MTSSRRAPSLRGRTAQRASWLALPLAAVACLYAYQLLVQGGREEVSADALIYLASARGEPAIWPFHVRVLGPSLNALAAHLSGLPLRTAFEAATLCYLLGALVILAALLGRRQASLGFEVAVVLGFGCAMAVRFGHSPVLVDTLLLLLVCLEIAALDSRRYALALAIVCLAAFTKEYGVFLAVPWAVEVYHAKGWSSATGALLPGILLAFGLITLPGMPRSEPGAVLTYHADLIARDGLLAYAKTLYLWLWAALWPVIAAAGVSTIVHLRGALALTRDQRRYSAMLVATPYLVLGDLDRALMVVVPFACLACASLIYLRNPWPCLLLGAGGLATSLARPLYSEVPVPRPFILAMIAASGLVSLALLWSLGRSDREAFRATD